MRTPPPALNKADFNQAQISKQLKASQCCVQNAIKKYKQLDRFDDLIHTCCRKKLSDREICHLKRLVKEDSRLSVNKIVTNMNVSLPEPVTTRTIR